MGFTFLPQNAKINLMKKLFFSILITILCLACTNKKEPPELITEEIIFDINTAVFKDREIVINQLRQPGNKKINIDNMFEITIPENMEIISITQRLIIDSMNPRYYVSHLFELAYHNKYFVLSINCHGNSNRSIINGNETFNLRTITTGIPSQIYLLQDNYNSKPFFNQNNIKLGKMVAGWGSHWTSDIYGLYLPLESDNFNECEITLYNLWGAFTDIDVYELNNDIYAARSTAEGGIIEKIVQDLIFLENSITYSSSDNSIKIIIGNIGEDTNDSMYIFPTQNNIHLRRTPSVSGEIIGYMEDKIYNILMTGENTEIDGIYGNWLMIIPFPYKFEDVAWVFSGYTRNPTNEELDYYFNWE